MLMFSHSVLFSMGLMRGRVNILDLHQRSYRSEFTLIQTASQVAADYLCKLVLDYTFSLDRCFA